MNSRWACMGGKRSQKGVDVKFLKFGPLLQEFVENNLKEMRCEMGDKGKALQGMILRKILT